MKSKKGTMILVIAVGAVVLVTFGIIIAFFANTPEYKEIETITPEAVVVSEPYVEHIVNPDRELFEGETLTVAVPHEVMLAPIAGQYMRANPGVTIEIIAFDEELERDGGYERVREEIGTQLMAGGGPTLMLGMLLDFLDPRSSHFFADWLPVMWADPNFNEDDWFMNVFQAAAMDGKLKAFPMDFIYFMATANSTIPGLPNALAEKESITIEELIELHKAAPTSDRQYYFNSGRNIEGMMLWFLLGDFVDMETGRVDFDNERFIGYLNYLRDNLNPDDSEHTGGFVMPSQEAAMAERDYFHFTNNMQEQYFLDFDEALFTEQTPIVNERGELIIYPTLSYTLNRNATPTQQAVAWDFIQFMLLPENDSGPNMGLQTTNRNLHRLRNERHLQFEWFVRQSKWQLNGSIEESAELIITKQSAYGDMPMFRSFGYPESILKIIRETLQEFEDGLISAEQAAANLQNKVELVMMEMGI